MKKYAIFLLLLLPYLIHGQAWFEDTGNENISIFKNDSNEKLFSARFNTKEGIGINFFNWQKSKEFGYVIDDGKKKRMEWYHSTKEDSLKTAWGTKLHTCRSTNSAKYRGWGVGIKTKADDGLGSLVSSGQFADGFGSNIYIAGERVVSEEEKRIKYKNSSESYRFWVLVISHTNNQYRFYRPHLGLDKQLSGFESVHGFQTAYSYFSISENKNKSNIIAGFNVGLQLKNNYKKLPKVDIKEIATHSVGTDSTRTFQTVDKDGYTYAFENDQLKLKHYGEFALKGTFGVIPNALNNRICLLTYPEVVFNKEEVKINIGFGIQFLKEGQPLISDAGIFIRLNDILNAGKSKDIFYKRSFEMGVTASLNILTGK